MDAKRRGRTFGYTTKVKWFATTIDRFYRTLLTLLATGFMLLHCGIAQIIMWIKPRISEGIRADWSKLSGPTNIQPLTAESKLSVVIPCLNEEKHILETLKSVLRNTSMHALLAEVIVADSGSTDRTKELVEQYALQATVRILFVPFSGSKGRGPALNAGLAKATGQIVCFVHADAIVPKNFDETIRWSLRNSEVLAGAFGFGCNRKSFTKPTPPGLSVMETAGNWRSRLYQLPYGDQAICMSTERLRAMGGFAQIPIMEDFELMERLRKASAAGCGVIKIFDTTVECSGRRWEKWGVARVNFMNQRFVCRYVWFGATPNQIYETYYGKPP
eukprot:m.133661 g.133661  ORF g.133661 m.133661 type:complete len:331 (-) comp29688_c0_seq2:97-1089(-)